MPDDEALDLTGREPVFADDFTGPGLDEARWLPHYLPHWTTPDRSAARYRTGPGGLELRIEADQPAWRPEDAPLRVSNLQTGTFSGPLGSPRRHAPPPPRPAGPDAAPDPAAVDAVVRGGRGDHGGDRGPGVPARVLARGPRGALAARLGRDLRRRAVRARGRAGRLDVRLGVKAHHDPRLTTDMVDLRLDLDATEEHRYAAEWDARRVRFFVDDVLVRTVEQGLDYPLAVMVDLFELPAGRARARRRARARARPGGLPAHGPRDGRAGLGPAVASGRRRGDRARYRAARPIMVVAGLLVVVSATGPVLIQR